MDRTKILLDVQKWMPIKSEKALACFVEWMPHYRGAQWADVLDILLEQDAHVEMTDAIYDDLRIIVPIGSEGWILPIFLTLLYYNKGIAPYATEVAYYHGWVTAQVQNEQEADESKET